LTIIAIVLVLISAFTHVGWNVLGKRNHPTAAFLLMATLLGCLCLSPSLLFFGRALAVFPAAVWRWLVVTGFFEALYYVALAGAYRTGDMSVVYPLARSAPVALVACISVLLGHRAQLSLAALVGIGLIIAGGFVLPLRRFSVQWSDYRQRATAFALLAAVGTAGYSLVDDHALRLLRTVPGLPVSPVAATLLYAFFEGLSSALWLTVWIAWRSARRAEAREVARLYLGRAWLAGFFIYLGYTLVLVAMGFATNVSYVVAFRQISIPLGALVGVFALKEPRYRPKFAGVLIMFAGLVLVAIG
jgi:drug/metabolite transporter (DMT)-like permease